MKDVFISGWCGYPELFGEFADEFEFVVPFITHSLQDISYLLEEGGNNLFAWSTGAYIVLEAETRPAFNNIVLSSPFQKFTRFTPERVLELMMKKFTDFPNKVVADFFKRCGSPVTPEMDERHFHILLHGLKYLIRTNIEKIEWDMNGVTLLHGIDDKIVNVEASRDIVWDTDCRLFEIPNTGHYIPSEILSKYRI
ncbi:MAG: hypothetical protein C0603_00460 [Denitrovibrio sp.]|nr:MAG: hypothetical protein C0603_00460 [Denitrovibrio sp.]